VLWEWWWVVVGGGFLFGQMVALRERREQLLREDLANRADLQREWATLIVTMDTALKCVTPRDTATYFAPTPSLTMLHRTYNIVLSYGSTTSTKRANLLHSSSTLDFCMLINICCPLVSS
jgi:hypothetical protein